jgi:HD-like signal output (HDOD) protein
MTMNDLEVGQELERVAGSIDIPPCPAILHEITAETNKPHPDFDVLEQLIKKDIGLSASLLQVVNSPFYGLRNKVESVKQSISLLGLKTISTMVYGLVVRNAIPGGNREFMEKFWDMTAQTAMAASFIAGRIGGIGRDDAYTFGLFMESGIPILMQKFPDYKDTLEEARSSENGCFTEIEDDKHCTDHATIGALLTRKWHLPEAICNAIRCHHDFAVLAEPESKLSPECLNFLSLGLLASQINYSTNASAEYNKWGGLALKHLNVSEQEYQDLMDEAHDRLDS